MNRSGSGGIVRAGVEVEPSLPRLRKQQTTFPGCEWGGRSIGTLPSGLGTTLYRLRSRHYDEDASNAAQVTADRKMYRDLLGAFRCDLARCALLSFRFCLYLTLIVADLGLLFAILTHGLSPLSAGLPRRLARGLLFWRKDTALH